MGLKKFYLIGIMICIVMVSGCTNQPANNTPLEQSCLASGGEVSTQMCCGASTEFPNTCLIGACSCSPENSKKVSYCNCGVGKCFNGTICVGNIDLGPAITSFEECVAAGYPIMKSNPPQCITPDGQTFIEEIKNPLEQLCNESGGNWNICSSKCMIDNQGKTGVACTMMCEALCECGGIAGFNCPMGYACKMPLGIPDALGYCLAESVGGQTDKYGCLGPAGYSWDKNLSACTRSWELNEYQLKAAKIAIGPLSYPVTVLGVDELDCIPEGCYNVRLQRNDNQNQFEIELENWTMKHTASPMPAVNDSVIDNQFCISESSANAMDLKEALSIASASECTVDGTLTDRHFCNNNTGTWWIDLNIDKLGCSPACVVNIDNKTAEINWRCTGLLQQ
jgi:hypothetical protein